MSRALCCSISSAKIAAARALRLARTEASRRHGNWIDELRWPNGLRWPNCVTALPSPQPSPAQAGEGVFFLIGGRGGFLALGRERGFSHSWAGEGVFSLIDGRGGFLALGRERGGSRSWAGEGVFPLAPGIGGEGRWEPTGRDHPERWGEGRLFAQLSCGFVMHTLRFILCHRKWWPVPDFS